MKKLDLYILRKFLGTFFYSIILIISISVIFDISEKLDDFIEKDAPLKAIVFDYYFNFIPFFANLFSPLFTFISVIFFTSRMASNTEIVAILSSGISFRRFLVPYLISATILAGLSFYLTNFIIPDSNAKRLDFEGKYLKIKFRNYERNIHRQIMPGAFIYIENFNDYNNTGYRFTLESLKGSEMNYKLKADFIRWDTIKKSWNLNGYYYRIFEGENEKMVKGESLDTIMDFTPTDFDLNTSNTETMDFFELNNFIDKERHKGSENIVYYLIEKYRRIAFPFATYILTLIGVSLASRKVRGGIGLHIGAGLLLSFSYIMFLQITTTFATNGGLHPNIAVWIPNLVFGVIAIWLYRTAPK